MSGTFSAPARVCAMRLLLISRAERIKPAASRKRVRHSGGTSHVDRIVLSSTEARESSAQCSLAIVGKVDRVRTT